MKSYKHKIAITTGDYNGIGAEITIKALNKLALPKEDVVIITNRKIIDYYGKLNVNYEIIDIELKENITPGKLSKCAGDFSFLSLKKACEIKPKVIVTAPISKEALNLAGHNFNGQTEILEYFLSKNNNKAEMLFISDYFDVFLLTRHCPISEINLSKELIIKKVKSLSEFYGNNAKYALCALNPHAGEGGLLGHEEEDIIIPAVKELQSKGIDITLPIPADTLFIEPIQAAINNIHSKYTCCIAMYHDQGLIPLKVIARNNAVNTTIGLPILRTSPAHGTAFDIAGKNIANCDSMIAAIRTSIKYQSKFS